MNVGTMYSSDQCTETRLSLAQELMLQFDQAGFHLVALQETRSRHDGLFQCGPYTRLACRGIKGQAGVELWLHKHKIADLCGSAFNPIQDVCVWHRDSRLLAASLCCGPLAIQVIVCYAPHRGKELQEIQAFWQAVDKLLAQCDSHTPVFLLGDFNCRLGSVTTAAVGDLNPDFEDPAGTACRLVCDKYHLCIPSTMRALHKGESHTFTSHMGHRSRIDFIAISQECRDSIICSANDYTIDVLNGDRDHHVHKLHLQLELTRSQDAGFRKLHQYDRNAARMRLASDSSSLLQDFPSQDWSLDVNEHWDYIRDHLQRQAISSFPLPKRQQRQDYFSPSTWTSLCDKKDMRIQHRQLLTARNTCVLRMFFGVWKALPARLDDLPELLLQLHTSRLQEAVVYEMRCKSIQCFRKQKGQDWKNWTKQQLQTKIDHCQKDSGINIFRVLQPKKMIAAKAGKNRRALPGLRDSMGTWHKSNTSIALAWQAQFAGIENAGSTSFATLLQKSRPLCAPLHPKVLNQVPSILDFEMALRALNAQKAPGLDGLGPGCGTFAVQCDAISTTVVSTDAQDVHAQARHCRTHRGMARATAQGQITHFPDVWLSCHTFGTNHCSSYFQSLAPVAGERGKQNCTTSAIWWAQGFVHRVPSSADAHLAE